jgi:Na+/proline symporter
MPIAAVHSVDVVIIAIYMIASFGIGIFASRFMHTSAGGEEDFYLAGRNVSGWLNGVSYAVTAMNADVAPLYCGLMAVIGLPIAWYYLSRFAFAWLIVSLLFAVRWRRLNISTGPEFYSLRFGGKGSKLVRVYTALFTIAVNIIPWIGAGLLGTYMIFGPIFEIESKLTLLIITLPVLLIYVWVSGFAGVLITDVMQTAVILVASLIMLLSIFNKYDGPQGLAQAITSAHPAEHQEILSVLPVAGHEVLGPLLVLAWMIVPTVGRGGSVDVDGQRMFSCANSREASKVPIWAACTLFAMLLLITLPILSVLIDHPEMYHATPSEREQAYSMLLAENLPTGVLGLAMAALLASVMSTVSGLMTYGAQTAVNDVLRPLLPKTPLLDPQSKACVWIGRLVMLAIMIAGVFVMLGAGSLFRIATIISGMFGASGAFFWAQWWWWRINVASWLAAMIAGPFVYLGLGLVLPLWEWWDAQLQISPANADAMAMLQAVISIGLTTVCWLLTALLTAPESERTLVEFYRRARPLGLWKPIREAFRREYPSEYVEVPALLLPGMVVAVVGTVWIALAILGLSQLAVGKYVLATQLGMGAALIAVVFRSLFNWHIARMEASQPMNH